VGRWLDRAKTAYAKMPVENDSPPASPSPHRVPAPSREQGRAARTLSLPDSAVLGKKGFSRLGEGQAAYSATGAQEAQEAEEALESPPAAAGTAYTLVDSPTGLGLIIEALRRTSTIGLDLETTGLRWWQDRIRLISITTEAEETFLVDAFKVDITALFPLLTGTKIIAHNAAFDLLFLKRAGFEASECVCTMILSQILWAGKLRPDTDKNVEHDLASVAQRALNVTLDKSHQKEDWAGELTPEMLAYAARDSMFLLPLHQELIQRIAEARGLEWVVDIEMRLLKAMVHISDNGLPIDGEKWARYVETIEDEIRSLYAEMDSHVKGSLPERFVNNNKKNKDSVPCDRTDRVNWRSAAQIGWAFEQLGITLPRTAKGNVSTSKDVMKGIDHTLARHVERLNKIKNLPTTFGKALKKRYADGRIYPGWNQCEADTGRMSCANPPLQGLPSEGELRKAVVAPEGYKLVVSDLSQIEIRVLAALTGDQDLIHAFEEGADIHRSVAATVLDKEHEDVLEEERKIAKSIVFGQMYGQGVEGLRKTIQNKLGREFSETEAREYWERFFDAYPGVKSWREKEGRAFDAGYRHTRTRKGRRRLDVDTKPKRWNSPIQGLAADVLKAITVEVHERRQEVPGLELVGLVHDEVICLVPEEHAERAAEWLTDIMEAAADTIVNGDAPAEARVPMKADTKVCGTWADQRLRLYPRTSL
jgi:DNA polymerase-1